MASSAEHGRPDDAARVPPDDGTPGDRVAPYLSRGPVIRRLGRIARHPTTFLAVLVLGQLGATIVLALTGPVHNGWAYYQGGDQIWLGTTSALLADLRLPPTQVGYGWPYLLTPIFHWLGPDYVGALPAVVLVCLLLLAPLGTLLVYAIGHLLGGRVLGLLASLAWVAAPFVSLLLFADRYHDRWVDQFLPQFSGLTAMSDFPSTILLLACAYLVLRSLVWEDDRVALLAGVAMGFAMVTKPSNLLFLLGPVLAYLAAWRFRPAVLAAAAMAPSVVGLALWKQRGLGTMPVLSMPEQAYAAGGVGPPPLAAVDIERYLDIDWAVIEKNFSDIDAVLWGSDVLKLLPLLGLVVVARISLPAAGMLTGWLLSFLVVKGANPLATVDSGSFFRLLMPSWPAYVILVSAIPLLVRLVLRRDRRWQPAAPHHPPGRRVTATLAVVLLAVPLILVGVARPIDGPEHAVLVNEILVPVTDRLDVKVRRSASGRTTITWNRQDLPAKVFYRVLRSTLQATRCTSSGAAECRYGGETIASTRSTVHVDGSPPPGSAYRIGVGANAFDDDQGGDVFLISEEAR